MLNLPHGESNITLACQNRCVSCNHFVPLQKPWFVEPADVARDLAMATKVMHFGIYNTVGGEPTLHPRIVDILRIIRESGITNRVEITTNGQHSERWPEELYASIDDLIVTPYKLTAEERQRITEGCKRHKVRLEWHQCAIFTYAGYKQPRPEGVTWDMYRNCWYAANRNVIDGGYFYRCCIGRFIPEVLLGLPREDDAIALDGLTEAGLRAFLNQPRIPKGCYVCGSNCAPSLPWHEQPDRERWLDESLL